MESPPHPVSPHMSWGYVHSSTPAQGTGGHPVDPKPDLHVSWGCYDKIPQMEWLKQKPDFLTGQEAQVASRGVGGPGIFLSPQETWVPILPHSGSGCNRSLCLCGHRAVPSRGIRIFSASNKDAKPFGSGPIWSECDLIELILSVKTLLTNKAASTGTRGWSWTMPL